MKAIFRTLLVSSFHMSSKDVLLVFYLQSQRKQDVRENRNNLWRLVQEDPGQLASLFLSVMCMEIICQPNATEALVIVGV